MKKLLLCAAIAVFGFMNINAQNGDFKVGLNLGLPIGDAGDIANFSAGLDVAYIFDISEEFGAGLASGYTNAFTKDITVLGQTIDVDDVQFIPIAVTGRYNVSSEFYLGTDIGYALGVNDGNDGGFYYRPRIGYSLSENLGLNLSYTGISRDGGSWDTINLGVEFGL